MAWGSSNSVGIGDVVSSCCHAFATAGAPGIYNALRITHEGHVSNVELTKSTLGSLGDIRMRDLLQLGLDNPVRLRNSNRLPAFIHRRGRCVLILMGPFKVVILKDQALFFDANRSSVSSSVRSLHGLLRRGNIADRTMTEIMRSKVGAGDELENLEDVDKPRDGCTEAISSPTSPPPATAKPESYPSVENFVASSFNSLESSCPTGDTSSAGAFHFDAMDDDDLAMVEEDVHHLPFELKVIDHVLKEITAKFSRRMRLFTPVVSGLLHGLTYGSETDAMDGLYRLMPIKK